MLLKRNTKVLDNSVDTSAKLVHISLDKIYDKMEVLEKYNEKHSDLLFNATELKLKDKIYPLEKLLFNYSFILDNNSDNSKRRNIKIEAFCNDYNKFCEEFVNRHLRNNFFVETLQLGIKYFVIIPRDLNEFYHAKDYTIPSDFYLSIYNTFYTSLGNNMNEYFMCHIMNYYELVDAFNQLWDMCFSKIRYDDAAFKYLAQSMDKIIDDLCNLIDKEILSDESSEEKDVKARRVLYLLETNLTIERKD